jgi:hypothetical protein
MRVTFFRVAERKSPKKGRPPVCDPFAVRRGKPASGRLRGAPWNSLCAARAARTTTASQSTQHARSDAHAHPATAPPQAQPAGGGQPNSQQPNSPAGLCFARPPLAGASASRCAGGAERSDGPCGCPIRGFPSGCAWGAQGAGWRVCRRTHALRELTHRSCSSGAPQARSEFCGAPRDRVPQVAPQRSEGVADSRVAFSLVTFFWRSKRKPLRRRAHTPAPALNPSTPSKPARQSFDQLSPNGCFVL